MRRRPDLPDCLSTSIGLRVPVFDRQTAPGVKISALEEYLLLTAFQQGELAEERLTWLQDRVPLQDEWDHLEGWEAHRRTRTETAVTQAKRLVAPDLYDKLQDNEWMIKRLSDEIERLENNASRVSRAYAMITGT